MKAALLFLGSIFFSITLFSQGTNLDLKLTNPLVNSPQSASFTKYGEIPVSLNSGIPNISIPIYTITKGDIRIPISISYHASGIKVEEMASNVGLGWSLQATGNISRQVRGLPDESSWGYDLTGAWVEQYINGPMSAADRQAFLSALRNGQIDAEKDLYYYSLPTGQSGKFFADNSGKYQTIPRSNLVITGSVTTSWTITDENGIKYYFSAGDYSLTNTQTMSYSSASPPSGFNDGPESSGVTAWNINKVTDTKGNDVIFSYAASGMSYYTKASETKKILGSNAIISFSQGSFLIPTEYSSISITHNNISSSHITKISWADGYATFQYDNIGRKDITGDTALKYVSVYNNLGNLIKRVNCYTSYFVNTPNSIFQTDSTLLYRLKLDSLVDISATGTRFPPYSFSYSSLTLPDRLSNSQDHWGYYNGKSNNATFVSYYQNVWGKPKKFGANRDVDTNYTQANILKQINYPTGGITQFTYENNTYHRDRDTFFSFNNTPIVEISGDNSGGTSGQYFFQFTQTFTIPSSMAVYNGKAVLLTKLEGGCVNANNNVCNVIVNIFNSSNQEVYANIADGDTLFVLPGTYTLSGTIETEFAHTPFASLHALLYSGNLNLPGLYNEYAGGLRIKNIVDKIGDVITSTKEYSYESVGALYSSGSIGYNNSYPDYSHIEIQHNSTIQEVGGVQFAVSHTDTYTSYSSTTNFPLLTAGGGYVTYGHVTVTDKDGNNNKNGKTEYVYTTFDDKHDEINTGFPYPPPCSYDWKRGLLLSEKYYKTNNDNSFSLVSEKRSKYNFLENTGDTTRRVINGLKAASQEIWSPNISTEPMLNSALAVAVYHTASEYYWLQNDTTITYTPEISVSTPLTVSKQYNYRTNPFQMTSVQTVNSKGDNLISEIKYPFDYAGTEPYNTMINRNELSPVVQQKENKNGTQLKIIKADYLNFGNGIIMPNKLRQQIGTNVMEDRISFNAYNAKGNILEQQKVADVKEVYLWGYGSLYPVAKILNTTYDIAKTYITQSVLDAPADDASLRVHLNNLRSIPGALVTTYTYKPLIGITSETDPRGKTTYYYYDAFNRLILVKDQDNNIVKKICYNYAGQVVDCNTPCIDTAANWQNTTTALRCQQGPCGNTGYQEQEQKNINPCSGTYNSTKWVSAGYNPTACTPGTCVTLTSNNVTGATGYVAVYTNSGGANYTFSVPATTGVQTLGTLPPGTYNLTIYRSVGMAMYGSFKSGCNKLIITGTSATYSNISVSSTTCNSITVDISASF